MKKIEEIVITQRSFFAKGKTRDITFRLKQLYKLRVGIKKYEEKILKALKVDLNKPRFEAYGTELGLVLEEVKFAAAHLRGWARPKRVPTSLVNFPAISRVYAEPYGVTLIMSPWNYPVLLALEPLVGALAAGNCAIIKPSNDTPHVSKVLKSMLAEIYPEEYVAVVEGGREENQSLLAQRFDYIFFTGSLRVGKLVMEAATKYLTPVSLELGGKSPCVVDETANIELAAKRIVWGKYLNAGQTCVAPDYVLVQGSVKEQLLEKMKFYIEKFHGTQVENSEDFPKIVTEKHYHRLLKLLESGKLVAGGAYNQERNQIAPTILDEVRWDSLIMQEEIFGPILPILTYDKLEDVVERLNKNPKPLAAYFFTSNKKREALFLEKVSFGGGCINDTVIHLVSSHMPFGGVGDSGMGGYHGKHSFDTFSHHKSILKKAVWMDIPLRYPPYKELYFKVMKRILK